MSPILSRYNLWCLHIHCSELAPHGLLRLVWLFAEKEVPSFQDLESMLDLDTSSHGYIFPRRRGRGDDARKGIRVGIVHSGGLLGFKILPYKPLLFHSTFRRRALRKIGWIQTSGNLRKTSSPLRSSLLLMLSRETESAPFGRPSLVHNLQSFQLSSKVVHHQDGNMSVCVFYNSRLFKANSQFFQEHKGGWSRKSGAGN